MQDYSYILDIVDHTHSYTMQIHAHTDTYKRTHIQPHACVHTCRHIHMYTYRHTCMPIYRYMHIDTCKRTHTYRRWCTPSHSLPKPPLQAVHTTSVTTIARQYQFHSSVICPSSVFWPVAIDLMSLHIKCITER